MRHHMSIFTVFFVLLSKATKQQVDALESRMEKLEQNLNYQTLEEEVLSLKSEIKNLKSKRVVRADNESMDGLITERPKVRKKETKLRLLSFLMRN